MSALLQLTRPKQWIKNAFVLFPLFFSGSLLQPAAILPTVLALAAFCLLASSVYCFNDIIDVEADRRHPVKCKRPLASGRVSVGHAKLLMVLLALGGVLLAYPLKPESTAVLGTYYVMNMAYCMRLKQYAIVDVCIVSLGFVLRILAGSYAAGIEPTNWIVLMTFLLTLFLSFAKRRDDVLRMNVTGEAPRKNTSRYNLTFINQAITITAAVTLVCYIMYTVSPEVTTRLQSTRLYLTSIFVLLGLLRYIQLAVVDEQSGDPTKVLLHDRPTQLIVTGWLVAFALIIYG